MLKIEVVTTSDHPLVAAARALFQEYSDELGVDLCFQGFAEELASIPGKYAPPRGVLLVVSEEEIPIACGALRELDSQTCELKRIFIRPTHRRRGLGRQITVDLMERARSIGYTGVRLDTLLRLKPAVGLYLSLGFQETAAYNFNPEADIAYFERKL